jgi:hypothetical protein
MSADLDTKGQFSASPEYLDGYVPSSWDAPHSFTAARRDLDVHGAAGRLGRHHGYRDLRLRAYSVGAQEHGVTIGIVGWVAGVVLAPRVLLRYPHRP